MRVRTARAGSWGHGARKDPWREHFAALGWRCWRVEASCRAGHSEDCQCTGDVGFGGRLAVGECGGGPRRFVSLRVVAPKVKGAVYW